MLAFRAFSNSVYACTPRTLNKANEPRNSHVCCSALHRTTTKQIPSHIKLKSDIHSSFLRNRISLICHIRKAPRRVNTLMTRAQASEDFYEILGVQSNVEGRDLKRAYRKLALKYHPDVNKAPNAQEQFLRIKQAYTTLSDPKSRAEYDRRKAWGGGATGGGGGGGWAEDFQSRRQGRRQYDVRTDFGERKEEDFYGFDDFFKDLENDMQAQSASGKPKSLWEELNDIGEEFVDFLEDFADKNFQDVEEKDWEELFNDTNYEKRQQAQQRREQQRREQQQREQARTPPPYEKEEESVDDMLRKLKKEMGLD